MDRRDNVMGRPRLTPPDAELRAMVEKGMTHREIALVVEERIGRKLSDSAIATAVHRAGASNPRGRRVLIPEGVREDHAGMYPARMLRAESRIREGLDLNPSEAKRLETWKAGLKAKGLVVGYHRCRTATCGSEDPAETGHPDGWFYTQAIAGEDILCKEAEAA